MKKLLHAYPLLWKNYFHFKGCTNKPDFWWAILVQYILTIAIVEALNGMGSGADSSSSSSVVGLVELVLTFPTLSATVRRLREKWGNIFWGLLPLIGWIPLIVMLCKPSLPDEAPAAPAAEEPQAEEPKAEPVPAAPPEPEISVPEPKPEPKKPRVEGIFYAFAAQGLSMQETYKDIPYDEAWKVYNEYSLSYALTFMLVRDREWDGQMESSQTGGVAMSSYNQEDFDKKIKAYLRGKNYSEEQIARGFDAYNAEGLHRINPFAGVYIMGIPIVTKEEEPKAEETE